MNRLATRQVAVLIETDDSWGRDVVEAIARFAHSARWSILIAPRDGQRRLRLPRGWKGNGILVSLRDRSMVRHIRNAGLPAVDVSMSFPKETWLGRVATDDAARARMAFEHFRARAFEHFAFWPSTIQNW